MLLPSGNPFKCHEEVLYFQLLIPPKRFDIFFPLTGGCSEGLGAFRFFFKLLLLSVSSFSFFSFLFSLEMSLFPSECVSVFSSHSFWTSSSLDVPAGVTQEEGHTGFLIHLLSAVRALTFLARRIQPFLSLVDCEVEFCVLTIYSFSTRWAFLFCFLVF